MKTLRKNVKFEHCIKGLEMVEPGDYSTFGRSVALGLDSKTKDPWVRYKPLLQNSADSIILNLLSKFPNRPV